MEGRRSLKRKSDEDQMSERESRQSSVRARISRDREQPDETAAAGPTSHSSVERKRFSFPGKSKGGQEASDLYQQPLLFSSGQRTKLQTGTTDFEAHLQEVWSVRKNIHHKQQQSNSTTTNTGSKTSILQSSGTGTGGGGGGGGGISLTQADKYSRYGVLPPPEPPQQRSRDLGKDTGGAIETVTPWSLHKPSTNFNKYSDPSSRHQQLQSSFVHPHHPAIDMTSSSPAARVKGRGRGGEPARICREDFEPAASQKRDQSEKVDYAKNMAKGYLRSVGSGEYAPPEHNYVKDPQPPTEKGKVTKWKRMDSDEFDF